MSEPLQSEWDGHEEPRPDRALYEQVAGDGDRTDHAAPTRAWFHRTTPRTAPQAVTPPTWATPPPSPADDHATGRRRARHAGPDARPAPEPEKPTTPRTPGKHARQLTDDEIFYFVARDFGKFFEEDFWRDVEFDRAIDHEPELE